ncbi:hypothetical protein PDIDSM_5842 [Penicillium digitatum]|nr:hypothetical protein PDIDSM_5842 [Penicillium digitatum]
MQGTQQDVPQGPSSNITLSRAELHEILDDALTRARTREVDNVRAIVDEVITARRDDIAGHRVETDRMHHIAPRLEDGRRRRTCTHSSGTTYYTNVYAFINQLKALIPLKSEEVVRANLPSCLREAAARCWAGSPPRKTVQARATEAIVKVMAPSSVYSWRDVRAGRSVTEWAQNMLRDAQAAEITGTTTVLRLVWTRLEPALQRDIREPSPATRISQFMADLDLRYGQWYEMFATRPTDAASDAAPTSYAYGRGEQAYQLPFRPRDTQTDNRQLMWNSIPNAQRTSYVPPQQQRPQGAYQPRQQQPQGQTNQAGQLVLSDKPWNQASYFNTGYVARQPRARPATAYQAEPQEVAPPDESLPAFYDGQHFYDPHNDAYYVDEEYNSYAEYPEEILKRSHTYRHLPTLLSAFLSNNKLHAHLKDCASRHTAAADDDTTVAYYDYQPEGTETDALPPDLPIIRSDGHELLSRGWLTSLANPAAKVNTCKSEHLQSVHQCRRRDRIRHLSSAYVSFDAFFRGADNAACIRIEAHLVENLKAKLLIGMDVIGHEGFRWTLTRRQSRSVMYGSGDSDFTHAKPTTRPAGSLRS